MYSMSCSTAFSRSCIGPRFAHVAGRLPVRRLLFSSLQTMARHGGILPAHSEQGQNATRWSLDSLYTGVSPKQPCSQRPRHMLLEAAPSGATFPQR